MTAVMTPRITVRTPSGILDCSLPDGAPVVPPDDIPSEWQTVFDSRNFDDLDAYFRTIVGHDPELSYRDYIGTTTIDEAWLENGQSGHVTETSDGYLVEAVRFTGTPRINTVSDIHVQIQNLHMDSAGALYGLQSQTNCRKLTVEHFTIDGNNAYPGGACINFPDATEPDQITLRFGSLHNWRAGLYFFGGGKAQFCHVRDLYYTPESHNTGASFRARNNYMSHCLIADGNSSAHSWYPENSPYTGIAEKNAYRLPEVDTGPEVLLAAKPFWVPQPGEWRVLKDCLFYRGGNIGGGGIGGELTGFTELSGNIDRNGDPVT